MLKFIFPKWDFREENAKKLTPNTHVIKINKLINDVDNKYGWRNFVSSNTQIF